MKAENNIVLDRVESYISPPRPMSIIGYCPSTFDPFMCIPIILNGAPPNFEEWYIRHRLVYSIAPEKDAGKNALSSLIHPSLCPPPAMHNGNLSMYNLDNNMDSWEPDFQCRPSTFSECYGALYIM